MSDMLKNDVDPIETRDWLQAIDSVIREEGVERAQFLIDQDKCRGWRLCISGCPYKKIYFNWKSGKSENVSSVKRPSKNARA